MNVANIWNKLENVWGWFKRPRNLALVTGIGACIAFLWDKVLTEPNERPAPVISRQTQMTSVTVQVPSLPSADAGRVQPGTSDAPQINTPQDKHAKKDLSGLYLMGVGAPIALSASETIEVVELSGFDHKYDIGLQATSWLGRIVRVSPGHVPFVVSLDGQLYNLSLSAATSDSATLKLDLRK